jgi:hypothetical protein
MALERVGFLERKITSTFGATAFIFFRNEIPPDLGKS